MNRDIVLPPRPGLDIAAIYGHPQSLAVKAGGLAFCSGMVAIDPDTGERLHGTVTSETARIFENLKLVLAAAGSSLEALVQIHAMIYDRIEYDVLNRMYRRYMPDGPPARTVLSVKIEAGFKVQLDAIAAAPGQPMAPYRETIAPANERLNVSRTFNLPHSPGIRAGGFLFLSGMVSIDPATGERALGTVASETRQILSNMHHLLESAGSSLAKVVKVNVMIYDMLEADNMNAVYRDFFPVDAPARTVCGVQLSSGLKVEIECIALA